MNVNEISVEIARKQLEDLGYGRKRMGYDVTGVQVVRE